MEICSAELTATLQPSLLHYEDLCACRAAKYLDPTEPQGHERCRPSSSSIHLRTVPLLTRGLCAGREDLQCFGTKYGGEGH